VKKDRIGSIGWCMGGGYALDVALVEPHLAATVINYGHLAYRPGGAEKDQRSDSRAFLAGRIAASNPDDVKKFQTGPWSTRQEIGLKIYPDAGHAPHRI